MNLFLILIGKLISRISSLTNLGNGSTWPGHIALSINKNFIKDILENSKIKIIIVAGTNGKTTTGKLIQAILEKNGKRIFQNTAGANLLNGISSSLISSSNLSGKLVKDFAILEIDENTLPLVLKELIPDYIILLNLFRDQLDRYGEVNTIAGKWKDAIQRLSPKTTLILNADDPQVTYLTSHLKGANVKYFGIKTKKNANNIQHASDSTYCPNCKAKLAYKTIYFSHLGDWNCSNCNYNHPKKVFTASPIYPLSGVYNEYNTNAAVLTAQQIGIDRKSTYPALRNFKPAFGRQEILNVDGKKVQIFLSKNPTSFNESLRTVAELGGKNLLIALNDRIPDGRDVSWIWDVDFEKFVPNFKNITISGDRAFDMGLRIKYSSEFLVSNFQFSMKTSNLKFQIEENLRKAIVLSLEKTLKSETLYVLPTYSAMLEVRKILTGRKIL